MCLKFHEKMRVGGTLGDKPDLYQMLFNNAHRQISRNVEKSENKLKAKSNFTLFNTEYIYTRSAFKRMEHCH